MRRGDVVPEQPGHQREHARAQQGVAGDRPDQGDDRAEARARPMPSIHCSARRLTVGEMREQLEALAGDGEHQVEDQQRRELRDADAAQPAAPWPSARATAPSTCTAMETEPCLRQICAVDGQQHGAAGDEGHLAHDHRQRRDEREAAGAEQRRARGRPSRGARRPPVRARPRCRRSRTPSAGRAPAVSRALSTGAARPSSSRAPSSPASSAMPPRSRKPSRPVTGGRAAGPVPRTALPVRRRGLSVVIGGGRVGRAGGASWRG